jgi:hypothetical protein
MYHPKAHEQFPRIELWMTPILQVEHPLVEVFWQVAHEKLQATQFPVPSIVNPAPQTQDLFEKLAVALQVTHPELVPLLASQVRQE